MTHLIIGTAGHIDHGKTALVRALTGIECDTHPEEKRRGITINLGFAHLELPGGDIAGIVDVPGHRDFIHTMVAGASGIDVAMLVVAADGGVMPQTREHLAIMEMLGVERGLVVLTRIDLAESGILEAARLEVAALVKGTFLDNGPMVAVSSKTGAGISELKKTIAEICTSAAARKRGDLFRMYIDRIFSVSGFGTVVTGSVLGGAARTGQELFLLPGDKTVRIRRIERYGQQADEVNGGDRASLNLTGLSREDFVRGMLVADRPLRSTLLLDVRVRLFTEASPVERWSTLQMYMGTFETQVRMHLIDVDVLRGTDAEAIAQLHLPQPCAPQAGDRFILRNTSNDLTIGGGVIIDAAPLHHRRRPPALVKKLHAIAGGNLSDLIAVELDKYRGVVSTERLAKNLNRTPEAIEESVRSAALPCSLLSTGRESFVIATDTFHDIRDRIISILTAHHKRNPLDPSGKTVEELLGMIGLEQDAAFGRMLESILNRLVAENILKSVKHTWALATHSVETAHGYDAAINAIDAVLAASGMQTPLESDLRTVAQKQGVDDRMLRQVLKHLSASKRVYEIEGAWLHVSVVDPARLKLLRELERRPEGVTVAQFRDLVGGNRKICLLMYALFDREGITVRDGDVRRITARGVELLRSPDRG